MNICYFCGAETEGHLCGDGRLYCTACDSHPMIRALTDEIAQDRAALLDAEKQRDEARARLAQAEQDLEAADDAIRFGYAPQLYDMEAENERLRDTLGGYLRTLIMLVAENYCELAGDDPEQEDVILIVLAWLTEAGAPWPKGCTEQWIPAKVPGSVRLPFRSGGRSPEPNGAPKSMDDKRGLHGRQLYAYKLSPDSDVNDLVPGDTRRPIIAERREDD